MDALISAAARALAAGDPLGALKRIALRDDAPALALRGIAMAQLGDLIRARALLRRAAGWGERAEGEPLAEATLQRPRAAHRQMTSANRGPQCDPSQVDPVERGGVGPSAAPAAAVRTARRAARGLRFLLLDVDFRVSRERRKAAVQRAARSRLR